MSHHLYNPYGTGSQSSTQGQYGLSSVQAERDPRSGSSHMGSGSTFSSSGPSSVTPANSRGTVPSLLTMPVNYRPLQNTTMMDKDIERSVEMHISRAREQVSDQSVGQGTRFTGTQRDKFITSSTGAMAYPMSPASHDHRHSNVETDRRSMDWLPSYNKAPEDESSKFYSSSGSSSYPSSSDGRFNVASGRGCDTECIPGLDDYNYPVPDKPVAPAESSRPKYTSETAASILLHFGLEKDDLEHLIAYPEDHITPDNLPFILRQIRIQKAKKTTGVAPSNTYSEAQPTTSVRGMDRLGSSIAGGMPQDEISSAILQPSKVIDYGHTGKYSGAVGEESGSGKRLLMGAYQSSGRSQEPPPKSMTEVTSRDQGVSAAGINSLYSSLQSSTQLNKPPQTNLHTFKKDTDIRRHVSEVSRSVHLQEPESSRQPASTTKPLTKNQPSCTLFRGVHPGRPGLVLIGNNVDSRPKDQSNTKEQKPKVGGQMSKQAPQQKIQQQQQQPKKQVQQQAQKQPQHWSQQQAHSQPVPLMGQSLQSAGFSASVPPPPFIHSTSHPIPPPVFMPGKPRQTANPPAPAQPLPPLMNLLQLIPPPSNKQCPPKAVVSKGLPMPAMIHDYAAATPRMFPHTCSLCKKECTHMKDWISHQNTSLHLENCRQLRTRYPDWDGEVLPLPGSPGKDAKNPPSTSAQTSQRRHQKTRQDSRSRSRSYSPHHRHDSEGRRDKRRSRSRSPHTSRHTRRSRSRSWSPLDRPTSSRYRSRSRSFERRLSPRRSREQRSPLWRSDEKRFSPRRSREQRSPPRRSKEKRFSPKRSREQRSPPRRTLPRRSHERRDEKAPPQRKKSSSAERLAKKLLETSAVQSLSKESDLEAVVKTLAPALLAELAKMKSPSSSSVASSSSTAHQTKSTMKSNKSKCSQQKRELDKVSSSNTVKLQEVCSNLSHNDVFTAVEKFGKIKAVVLLRSKQEAAVHFEREEDAKKLKTRRIFHIKGKPVFVAREEDSKKPCSAKERKKPPLKSATPGASTPQTIKPTSTGKAALPSPKTLSSLPSGAKKSDKLVTKAKVLVSKAKNVSTKQMAKTVKKGNNTVKSSVKQPDAGGPKQKQAVKVSKAQKQNVAQPNKDTDEKVPQAKTASTTQEPETQVEISPAAGVVSQENDGNTAPSKPTTESLPNVETVVPKTEAQESVVVPEVTIKAEPLDLEETGVAQPMLAEHLVECKMENLTETQPSSAQTSQSHPTTCAVEIKPDMSSSEQQETSIRAAVQVQPSTTPDPDLESKAQGLDTTTNALQLQAEGNSAEAALEAEDPVTTQKDPAAKEVNSVSTEVAATAQTDLDESTSSSDAASLTFGERIEKLLFPAKIPCLCILRLPFLKLVKLDIRLLLISNLPEYHDGCYTKEDIANVLVPFGFQYTDENIYVIPQTRMAFALMPGVKEVQHIIKVSTGGKIVFSGSKLRFEAVKIDIPMTPFGFYTSLMMLMRCRMTDTGARTIYIKNISHSEIRELREALRKIDSVRNFLPLLNEVFIEFDSIRDADRLGVWFSLLKRGFSYKVYRQKIPQSGTTALSPRLAANAFPDSSRDVVAGATIPTTSFGIPKGSNAPFWVTMTTNPFVFPTTSPWFIIPEFLTVSEVEDIEKVGPQGSALSTIMLTGLPENHYKHEDVAQLVWPYLPKHDLHSLYYSVTVLTLQRRAFVYFTSWDSCCTFVRDHVKNPVCVTDSTISVHLVLEDMTPGFTEETMYRSLMKWSNAHVPDLESLEERLLCVEISEMTMDLVMIVMDVVASIASFVSFLPLANRICIEMAEPSGVTQVVERIPSLDLSSHETWSKVRRFEPLQSLKQRLQDSSEITLNLGTDTAVINTNPPTHDPDPPPDKEPGPSAASTVSESITADPSDVEMTENDEKPEMEISLDSDIVPTVSKDAEKEEVKEAESPVTSPAASILVPSTTALIKPEETVTELPHIDSDLAKAIIVAVQQHRLTRESTAQNDSKEAQDDFSGDVSTDRFFDEQNFNLEDFVTVDEIVDDVDDTAVDHHSSSSSHQSSREKQERQSSEESSPAKPASTRSPKDSKSSASSSKPDKASVRSTSTSLSPKRQKVSPEPIRSQSRLSSSASAGKSSASSSTLSSPVSLSKTVSPSRASYTRTRSSKTASAAAVETPVVSGRSSREGSKPREGALEKSDPKASSKDAAVETKTEAEIHLPAQELKSESMSPETDSKDQTFKELIKSETDDTEKQTEEKGDGENDQTLDSLNDKTDEPMTEERNQDGNTNLQSPGHGEDDQVLDITDGKVYSEEGSEMVEGDSSSVKPEESAAEDASELDTGREQSPRTRGQRDEELLSEESCKSSKDSGQIPNDEEQPCEDEDALKEEPEQEAFEILDSIDDQTGTGDEKPEAPRDQIQREDLKATEEEEDSSYQVIDSVEDQPTTEAESEADLKETRTKKGSGTANRDDRATRRSGPTTRTSKTEDKDKSPKKQERTVKEYESRTRSSSMRKDRKTDEDTEDTEDMVYEIVDSVEDESVGGGEKTTRGNKEVQKMNRTEEATYKIVDSVEDEASTDEPTVARFTRGRRERAAKKDVSTPPRRRQTPARESQERIREKKEAALKETTPTRKSVSRDASQEDATFRILDEVVELDQATAPEKGRRGRPRKGTKVTKKQTAALKKDDVHEEEATYQILDSVGDETVDDQPPGNMSKTERTSASRKKEEEEQEEQEEEEEPLYQIVDSLEDDPVQEETEVSDKKDVNETTDEKTTGEDMKASVQVLVKEDSLHQSSSENVEEDEEEHKPTTKSQSDAAAPEEEEEEEQQTPPQEEARSSLVNLEEVSEEEEDYPDDTAEEEELKRRQAVANEREERRSRDREERERRRRSRSRGGVRRQQNEEEPQELVTLDEVGGDEAGQEGALDPEWDTTIPEGELQLLVTLDEIGEEEEEEKEKEKEEETSSAENERDAEKSSRSAKRKHDDATEESENFVTVDEVGEVEEEEKEAVSTRTRGRAKKRTRQTPGKKNPAGSAAVRKSTRGKTTSTNNERGEEEDSSSTLDPESSGRSAENQLENQSNHDSGRALSKRRSDLVGPEAKRSRSQSPCVAADFRLPPFPPSSPLGQEFVITGFFCKLCSVFYSNESTAMDAHCSSLKHYHNLQKHYLKLQQKPQTTSGCVSD